MHQSGNSLVVSQPPHPPAPPAGTVSPQGQHIIDETFPLLLRAIAIDLDKPAVAAALTAGAALVQAAGLLACQAYVSNLAEAAAKVLSGQAPCQAAASDDEGEEDAGNEVRAWLDDGLHADC